MIKKIAVIGYGGLGRELGAQIIRDLAWAGYFDDNIDALPGYLGHLEEVNSDILAIVAVGDPRIKRLIVEEQVDRGCRWANLISKHCSIVDIETVKLSEGTVITDGAVLTTNIRVGTHVLINNNVSIGHDTIIGDFCSIMPGANISGDVDIGEGTLVGSGSVVLQGIRIGENVKVGAGAVVTQNIPDDCTVVGVPAKIIKRHA